MTKTLSLKQPWGYAIMHAGKRVENRTWTTKYRGRLGIHVGRSVAAHSSTPHQPGQLIVDAIKRDGRVIKSALLGYVDLVDVHHADDCRKDDGSFCSTWAVDGHYHWELSDPAPLPEPIPMPGKLHLWDSPDA